MDKGLPQRHVKARGSDCQWQPQLRSVNSDAGTHGPGSPTQSQEDERSIGKEHADLVQWEDKDGVKTYYEMTLLAGEPNRTNV